MLQRLIKKKFFCTTYVFFTVRVDPSFSNLQMLIVSVQNDSLLCFLCSYFGYIDLCTLASLFSPDYDFFLEEKNQLFPIPSHVTFLNHCPSIRVIWSKILKICTYRIRTVLVFHILIIDFGIILLCLSNLTPDIFFKYYFQLKSKHI